MNERIHFTYSLLIVEFNRLLPITSKIVYCDNLHIIFVVKEGRLYLKEVQCRLAEVFWYDSCHSIVCSRFVPQMNDPFVLFIILLSWWKSQFLSDLSKINLFYIPNVFWLQLNLRHYCAVYYTNSFRKRHCWVLM